MNFQNLLKKSFPYVIAVIFFILLSTIYFYPLLQGKSISQMDDVHAKGMSKELADYHNQTGEHSMWTNSMFGGMPAYQIRSGVQNNIFIQILQFLRLGLPFSTIAILFLYLLGFYILLLSLKIDKWLSIIGAIAFAFASYNLIIVIAGHLLKAYAIATMAPVLAGFLLLYDKKYLAGGILTLLAMGIQIACNHPQITYYLGLIVFLLIVVKLIYAIKEKEMKHFAIATVIGGSMCLLSVLPAAKSLWSTYEYSKETIRGESELSQKDSTNAKKSTGLDKDYALAWSYGKGETFTLLIPDAKGGSTERIGDDKVALQKVDGQYREMVGNSNRYWGDQPFTSGPVYLGAIMCFLFVLGLFFVKGALKWWLVSTSLLSILLSWGHNFPIFTDFFFYYVPLYNKFRTVAMALVIAGVTIPLLGILAVKEILEIKEFTKEIKQKFYYAFGITAGLTFIFYIAPSAFFSFISGEELQRFAEQKTEMPQYAQQIDVFMKHLESARIAIFKSDTFRSLMFILLSGIALAAFIFKKLKKEYLFLALGFLILIDLWIVDRRYLGEKDFHEKSLVSEDAEFPLTPADKMILKDKSDQGDFRVLNLTRNVFNDGYTPYHHKSVGGYHGAKLRRYQDLIDKQWFPTISILKQILQKDSNNVALYRTLPRLNVMNMLNTKYIIAGPNSLIPNPSALGATWFVKNYKFVNSPDEEIEALTKFEPEKTVIIDQKKFANIVAKLPKEEFISALTDTPQIKLVEYRPGKLKYEANTQNDRVAVFSEIYYPIGWNAYIDGKSVDHFRVNYVLRAAIIPAGKHIIEFKFEPKSVSVGQKIGLASSILVVLLILGGLTKLYLDSRKQVETRK